MSTNKAALDNIDRLRAEIHDEMVEIVTEVSSELARIGRQDLNTKLARYSELTGQDVDLIFEMGSLYFMGGKE